MITALIYFIIYLAGGCAAAYSISRIGEPDDEVLFWGSILWPLSIPLFGVLLLFATVVEVGNKHRKADLEKKKEEKKNGA